MKLDTNYIDRNKTVQCDAEEGCLDWPHWECEGFTETQIDRIDKYNCKGCIKKGLGKMTYKPYNAAAEIPDDAVENDDESDEVDEDRDGDGDEDEDDDVDEVEDGDEDEDDDEDEVEDDVDAYIDESEDQSDSHGSGSESGGSDNSSQDTEPEYDGPETESDGSSVDYQEPITDSRKRKAASQTSSKPKAQKMSK